MYQPLTSRRLSASAIAIGSLASAGLLSVPAGAATPARPAAPPTPAAPVAPPEVDSNLLQHCGNFLGTCTFYFSQREVQSIDGKISRYANASNAAVAAAFAAACSITGNPLVVTVCAGVGAIGGGYVIDQFNAAAARNACVALKYTAIESIPISIGPYSGQYCTK